MQQKRESFLRRAPLFTAAWWARAPGGDHPRPSCGFCAAGTIRPAGSRAPGFPSQRLGRGGCGSQNPARPLPGPEFYQCWTEFGLTALDGLHVRELTGSLESLLGGKKKKESGKQAGRRNWEKFFVMRKSWLLLYFLTCW